jgi:hypothetical protein
LYNKWISDVNERLEYDHHQNIYDKTAEESAADFGWGSVPAPALRESPVVSESGRESTQSLGDLFDESEFQEQGGFHWGVG